MYSKKSRAIVIVLFLILILAAVPVFTACSSSNTTSTNSVSTSSSTPASQTSSIELSLATLFPPTAPPAQQLQRWADSVKAATNGQLTIRIYPSETLLKAPDIMNGVKAGSADIGASFPYQYTAGQELLNLLSQLIRGSDYTSTLEIFNDFWSKYNDLLSSQFKDYKLLWTIPIHPNLLFTIDKPVRTLDDLKGLQIRIPSAGAADIFKQLGATPVSMSTSDWIVSLDKHTTDGGATSIGSVSDYNIGAKLKYCTEFGSGPGIFFVVMNNDSYNKLSPALQQALDGTLETAKQDDINMWKDYESTSHENDVKLGMQFITLSNDEYVKWNDAVQPAFNAIAEKLNTAGYPGTEIVQFSLDEFNKYHSQ